MDWTSIATAAALSLSINFGLMAINRKRRNDVAERVDGLLQKFRDAAALAADAVGKLVAADAIKAAEIERLTAEIASAQDELAEAREQLMKYDGSYIISNADIDELGDIAARFQNVATAASMPLLPKSAS